MTIPAQNCYAAYRQTIQAIQDVGEMIARYPRMPVKQTSICIDESEKFHDSEVVTLAGCLAESDVLNSFTDRWSQILSHHELPYTSMKEAMHCHGPYLKWKDSKKQRDAVIRELAEMLVSAPILRVHTVITSADFKALPPSTRAKLGNDPHYCGFEACVLGAFYQSPGLVQVVFDLAEEYSERCVTLFNKLRRNKPDVKSKCVALTFADDEVHAGLQAADMLAYCMRADALRGTNTPAPLVEGLIELFKSHDLKSASIFYEAYGQGLGDAGYKP